MQIAVLGVGLIGGSIGLAARKQGYVVAGWDVDQGVLTAAAERDAVDRAAASAADALTDAEAAFLCAPVGALPSLTAEALAAAGADCVVTDVGSTKRALAATTADERFIGGHPIAGSEASGVEHARAELFEGAAWYLTPGARSSGVLYERLHGLLVSFGARPVAIDAEAHDRLLATVSHPPPVLGIVARVARAHGGGGVSIADLALGPGPGNRPGWFRRWVAGEGAGTRAAELIGELGFPVAERA